MAGPDDISIIILSFNSATSIARTIRSVQPLSSEILVVDSYSEDDTVAVCEALSCTVVQRPFRHYADQRNWAIDNLPITRKWQLHVDADEEFTPALVRAIQNLDLTRPGPDGYIIGRKIVFLGRTLRFGAIGTTWHYRLFRTGFGRCEDRLYDQHFVGKGTTGTIGAFMLDHQDSSIAEWTRRHNRWSDLEAEEAMRLTHGQTGEQVVGNVRGTAIERKRFVKSRYYRLPLFWRSAAYFFYGYVLKLGFLDGARGFIFAVLQALWFRVLIDAKIFEAKLRAGNGGTSART